MDFERKQTLEIRTGSCKARRVYHDCKRFVDVLRSSSNKNRYYVGITSNVAQRLVAHNEGHLSNTARYRPWSLNVVLEFANQEIAERFEKYLKSGSGRAFAKKHFE